MAPPRLTVGAFLLLEACAGPPSAKPPAPDAVRTESVFAPDSACERGPRTIELVKECGCDDEMACKAAASGDALDLRITWTKTVCKDCGRIAVSCEIPADIRKFTRITVEGKPLALSPCP
jgi:hypothetical protein